MTYKKPKYFKGVLIEGAAERFEKLLKDKANAPQSEIIQPTHGEIYVPSIQMYVSANRDLFNNNWNETHEILQSEGLQMLTPREFFEFLNYLASSQNQDERALYNDILKTRDPWQGEWLDAKFKQSGNIWTIESKTSKQTLANWISEDCFVDLKSINPQGLPTRKSPQQSYQQGQNIYYWHPRDGRVAGFDAGWGWAGLICDRNPAGRSESFGVRPSRKKN